MAEIGPSTRKSRSVPASTTSNRCRPESKRLPASETRGAFWGGQGIRRPADEIAST